MGSNSDIGAKQMATSKRLVLPIPCLYDSLSPRSSRFWGIVHLRAGLVQPIAFSYSAMNLPHYSSNELHQGNIPNTQVSTTPVSGANLSLRQQ